MNIRVIYARWADEPGEISYVLGVASSREVALKMIEAEFHNDSVIERKGEWDQFESWFVTEPREKTTFVWTEEMVLDYLPLQGAPGVNAIKEGS